MLKNEKGITLITLVMIIIIVLIVLAGVGFSAYRLGKNKGKEDTQAMNENNTVNNTISNKTENTHNNDTTTIETKYTQITDAIPADERLSVTNVEKENGKYLIQGVIYSDYTITKQEFDDLKNGKTIMISQEEYKYTTKNDEGITGDYLENKSQKYVAFHIERLDSNTYVIYRTAQFETIWTATDKYVQIELDPSTKFTNYVETDKPIQDGEVMTLEKAYDLFDYHKSMQISDFPYAFYNFKFENGKCVEMYAINSSI